MTIAGKPVPASIVPRTNPTPPARDARRGGASVMQEAMRSASVITIAHQLTHCDGHETRSAFDRIHAHDHQSASSGAPPASATRAPTTRRGQRAAKSTENSEQRNVGRGRQERRQHRWNPISTSVSALHERQRAPVVVRVTGMLPPAWPLARQNVEMTMPCARFVRQRPRPYPLGTCRGSGWVR